MTLRAGTVVGDYCVEGVLGRGGMATVYAARHEELGRRVALKVLLEELGDAPEFLARFQREGRTQGSLDHPHVVTVFEAGESEHGPYLAMRLVSGSTLAQLIEERALDADRALALLCQVAEGLDAAHAAGLVHRDVKPQNVLVGEADDAYLGDFGLTRIGGTEGVTATGQLVGTVAYLAPEVIRGAEAAPASDRYAFAAMVFKCLTGTAVFPRQTQASALYAHTNEPPPRISGRREELPTALDEVFSRALSKDPGERPRSAIELLDAVGAGFREASSAGLGPPPPPGLAAFGGTTEGPLPPASRRSSRLRLLASVVAGIIAGAAVATAVAVWADDESKSAASDTPPALAGAQVLGSDLGGAGRALGCRGGRPRASSPSCTVLQSALPDRTLVVPEDGVIRRWAVRSARGELALAVLRARGGGAFQVARSRNEFVGNSGIHVFDANLAVERGDLVGLVALPGSAVGVRTGLEGASTRRWIPSLTLEEPADLGPGTGFDHELLLRVELVAGGRQRRPNQVTGADARQLAAGRVHSRRRLRFANGRPVEVALVGLGDQFALDEFVEGRRTARIGVPDLRPKGGRLVTFEVYTEESEPEQLGVYIEYANAESARIIDHFYDVYAGEFKFVD